MSSAVGRLAVLSFVGVVVAYKLGKYHAVAGFTSSTSSSSSSSSTSSHFSNGSKKKGRDHKSTNRTKLKSEATNSDGENMNTKRIQPKPQDELESITLKPIGKISSVYRLCVGTPRQGLLAPNSRGRIDLFPNQISSESVLDLDQYSHIWIVFIFHLNSLSGKQRTNKQFPAKISPPALGGKRVGVFATRTPHRPNPVGFSLCKIDKVVIPKKKKHCKAKDQPYSVYVSGLDLVDGTPVLDIKPYVPHYDSVGYMGLGMEGNHEIVIDDKLESNEDSVHLPQWVSEGLDKRRAVAFTESAEEQLSNIMNNDETATQMEFYGTSTGRDDTTEEALEKIKSCIEEVLSVDVRSSFQTKKARKGKFQAERAIRVSNVVPDPKTRQNQQPSKEEQSEKQDNNICTQQLDRLLITYTVEANNDNDEGKKSAVDTSGSGADDKIVVIKVELMTNQKK